MPLISIITVVYNGEKYLEQTINSVLNQTYKNIEYIIIDGQSTDGTIDIIREYESHLKLWISEKDAGLYDAMNKGIKLCSGELIGMINSDDWYEPNAVERVVDAYIKNSSKRIFHADRFDIDSNEERLLRRFHPSVIKFQYYGMTYHHPSMFISPEEYSRHLYSEKLKVLSDYQFVLEAYLFDKSTFEYIPESIVNYRLDGVSAQIGLFDSLKEGFSARKNAKMSFLKNSISFLFRAVILSWKRR